MNRLVAKIGDISEVKRGTTITQKNAIEGSIPVVAGGIKPTYFHNTPNRLGKTVTISGSGANAGYVNFWNTPIFASDCSTVQVFRDDISIYFIHYFLLSKQEFIYQELRSGAAQPHVYGKDIANIEVSIPPLVTQQKIVAKLDAIFAEIDKATAAAEANAKNADLFVRGTIEKLIRGLNSDCFVKFGDICSFIRGPFGGSLKKSIFVDKGYAVYEQQHPINNQFDSFRYFIDDSKFNEMKRFEVFPHDLLMSCSGVTLGKIAIVPKNAPKGIINQALLKITPKSGVSKDYLKIVMDSDYFQSILWDVSGGAAQPNVPSVKVIKDFLIPMPSVEEQEKVVDVVTSIRFNDLKNIYIEKKLLLMNFKNSVLKKAFTGELVKE